MPVLVSQVLFLYFFIPIIIMCFAKTGCKNYLEIAATYVIIFNHVIFKTNLKSI